ncbi:MAG TPA: hypothetical protein DCX53_10810 [Anaerolineae bacterium]|nr:hypothetical protein [Anaerolineae bacterium]
MKKRNRILLSAIVVLILSSLACAALSTEPGASNFYMAKDSEGEIQTSVFSSTDDFYVFFDVSGVEAGANFESRWYALNIEGQDPNTPFQTIEYAYEEGISTVYFQLFTAEGWPAGNYRVEVYLEGAKVGEQSFSVQ